MASTVTPGVPVVLHDLAAVEEELERLWQANAVSADAERAPALMRAATFNLIAIAPGEREAEAAAGVLAAVTAQHPGRVLIVSVEPEARESRLEAWVALHCRTIDGAAQVCGEQVVIAVAGAAVERLHGALAALLLPDCPAIAWWRGGPGAAAMLLDRLAPALDAVLLDGDRFTPATLPGWVARAGGEDGRVAVGDLAWERGAPWRRWTADGFDPLELRPALGRLATVRVTYEASAEMAALLYLGWLASRLGWRPAPGLAPASSGGWAGALGGPAGQVAVSLRPAGPGAGLVEVALETAGPERIGCVVMRQGPHCGALAVTRGDEVVLRHAAREAEPDEVALVGRWLERPRRGPLYADALAALAAMCEAGPWGLA